MRSVLKITRFHFATLINLQIAICAAVLLLHILISIAVIRLADAPGPAGVGDIIGICWVIIIGLIFFAPSFKYMLSQGISRKTYFFAGSLSIVLMAAAIALVITIFYIVNLKVSNVWMIYELIYGSRYLPGVVVWEFAALLFLGVLSWFIRLVYYVSSRPVKIIISIAPFILAAILILINALTGGGIGRSVFEFVQTVMGLSYDSPNPFIGTASMIAASVILSGPIFLLLRRAQIND